jgi:hypothetical protein
MDGDIVSLHAATTNLSRLVAMRSGRSDWGRQVEIFV